MQNVEEINKNIENKNCRQSRSGSLWDLMNYRLLRLSEELRMALM
ncbi:MAG: hypothetical protein ACLR7D_05235 [Lachnospira eligens]